MKIDENKPQLLMYRNQWIGPYLTAVVIRPKRMNTPEQEVWLIPAYRKPLPLSGAKFKDLQVLKKFCLPRNQLFYESLPLDNKVADEEETIGTLQDDEQ